MNYLKLLKKLDSSLLAYITLCICILLLIFYCNMQTDLVADDFRYFFSFADESRIESIWDIFPSMAAHRHSMNGRVIAHFLVQVFLLLPSVIFKLLNSVAFLALLLVIYRMSVRNGTHSVLLLASIFGCVWLFQPDFGQVFLWLTGSVNYLWCAVLCMMYLRPFICMLIEDREPSKLTRSLLLLSAPFVGAYGENSSVALIFMLMLIICIYCFYYKRCVALWMYLSVILAFIGFMYMMLAPAESVNKSAELSLLVLLGNFAETGLYYLRFWPLIIVYLLSLLLAIRDKLPSRLIIASVILFLGSLAGHFVLIFAMYCSGRSTYIGLVLLISASAILLKPLFAGKYCKLLCAICVLCLVFTAFWGYKGVRDIQRTHYLLSYNEALATECIANGEADINLPRPYAKTKYSALEGLSYLDTDDSSYWANRYMALYYGADSILGY